MSITLLNGDCLEVMKTLEDKSVDLFICDLPYGCLAGGFKGNGGEVKRFINGKETANKIATEGGCSWDIKINLEAFWKEVKRLAKNDNSPVIHFCTTKFGYELIQSNPSWFRYDLVWDKQRGVSFLSANKMPMRSHEMIYIFSKSGAYYKRKDEDAPGKGNQSGKETLTLRKDNMFGTGLKRSNGSDKDKACVKSVIQIKKVGLKTQGHPTEKPEDLYKWLIERYCPPGGTVLDPTAGSFNSCFVAYELNMNAIGIEKDEGFYKKASDRADKLSES
jgi:site-specific DNA-methyltransferase (adenine-specific)